MIHNPTNLKELLKDSIRSNGPMRFKDFMQECLYHQELGYYSQQVLPIGKHGDFVTAPHASKFFGSLIAVQITECFKNLGLKTCSVCEFGAGAGFMARDIMSFLREFYPEYYDLLTYFIPEPLLKRRDVLKKELSEFSGHAVISDDFSRCEGFQGVIVANELIDAFPVHVVEKHKGRFLEVFVNVDNNGNFKEILMEPSSLELMEYLESLDGYIDDNYRTEVNLAARKWICDLAAVMEKGYVIIIDYGFSSREYYAAHRNRGTLLGYSRQRTTEDFFSFPGMVDITAHVNFTDIKLWAESSGMRCEGYTPQWAFLGGLNPDKILNMVFGTLEPFSPVLAGIKALIFPQAMGESHKVMILSKGVENEIPLKGFSIRDYSEDL